MRFQNSLARGYALLCSEGKENSLPPLIYRPISRSEVSGKIFTGPLIATAILSTEGAEIEIRKNIYLNNLIEQDHRPIKLLCRATLGFHTFRTAKIIIAGFEAMRVIRKRQVKADGNTSAEIFYSLAD